MNRIAIALVKGALIIIGQVFALGFGQKTVCMARLCRKPIDIVLCVFPGNVDDGMFVSGPSLVCRFIATTAAGRDTSLPFVEGDRETADRKGSGKVNVIWFAQIR